jgi:NAD(P)H-dependent FMN reductase
MATITVFFGSTRNGRMGDHVGHFIVEAVKKKGHTVHVIDPNQHEELLVLRSPYKYTQTPSPDMKKVHETLTASDGFIVITPEYNHSYSGAIKNALDMFMDEYHGKPFGIVTYSAGPFGGIRAAEALRPVISELKAFSIPMALPISSVNTVFDEHGKLADQKYTERVQKFLDELDHYVQVLKKR